MRPIIGYLLLFLLLFSCTKEDSQYFPLRDFYKSDYNLRIKKFRTSYNTYAHYIYNDKGFVEKIYDVTNDDSSLNVEFKYDMYDRLIYSKEFYNLGREMETYNYQYSENQVIINVEISSKYQNELVVSEKHRKWILHYNDLGECISNEVWWYKNQSEDSKSLLWNTTYTWVKGNVVTKIKKFDEYQSDTSYYEFDTLTNPVRGLTCYLIPEYALSNLSKNNVLKETYKQGGFFYGVKSSRYIYASDNSITKENYLEQFNRWSTDWMIEFE